MDDESFGISFEYKTREPSADSDSLINYTEFSQSTSRNDADSPADSATGHTQDGPIAGGSNVYIPPPARTRNVSLDESII